MKNNSEFTFIDIAEHLGYEKVIWNGEVVYDEDRDDFDALYEFQKEYNNKIVYEITIKIIHFPHIILDVKGEN